jgi:Family of unknown function (DUF5670)
MAVISGLRYFHYAFSPLANPDFTEAMIMRFGPFLGLAILLLVLWAGGFLMFHVAGALIHLLLLLAVISLVVHLFSGRRTA